MTERKFKRVTKKAFEEMVKKAIPTDYGYEELLNTLKKDLKVEFDSENFESNACVFDELTSFLGVHTLSSGLTFWGFRAGGDWEYPVHFIVYWDGKKLRGYVPIEGNPWNTTTKRAYGNDDEADRKNAKKRWGVVLDGCCDVVESLPEETSARKMLEEIRQVFVEAK